MTVRSMAMLWKSPPVNGSSDPLFWKMLKFWPRPQPNSGRCSASCRPSVQTRRRMFADCVLPTPVKLPVMLDTTGTDEALGLVRALRTAIVPERDQRATRSTGRSCAESSPGPPAPLAPDQHDERACQRDHQPDQRGPLAGHDPGDDHQTAPADDSDPRRCGAQLDQEQQERERQQRGGRVGAEATRRTRPAAGSASSPSGCRTRPRIGTRDTRPSVHAALPTNSGDVTVASGTPAIRIAMPPASMTNFVWKMTSDESCPLASPIGAARRNIAKNANHAQTASR